MGLLGDADSQANFALAAGLLGGGNFGQAFGRGLAGYQAALNQDADRKMQEAYRRAQMLQIEQAMQQRQAGTAAAQMQADLKIRLANDPAPDFRKYLAAGLDPKWLADYAGANNLGKPKVARTLKGIGPDGREYEYQVDEQGNRIGEGLPQFRAPLSVNQGNQTTFADPYTLKPVGSFQINQSPDSIASTAVSIRGQNMTDARARETLAQGNKPPAGYRMRADGSGLEAIPGGPADLKQQGMLNADTGVLTSSTASMDRLATAANALLNHPGLAGITGLRGAVPNIPGTEAADAQALLNTLKSQVAFGVLQDMRNNSKTGGALGNVSDAEGKRLEANLAALEKAQSLDQMKRSLGGVITYAEQAKGRLREAYNLKHGDAATGAPDQPAQPQKFNMLPPAKDYAGKRMKADDGTIYRSNGTSWVKE